MTILLPLLAGGHFGQQHADRDMPGMCKRPSVLSPGRVSADRNRELDGLALDGLALDGLALDGLQIRGRQFAALAHNVVADLLPLVEVAHAGAFDRGNVDEHIFPTILRLYEAKAPLGIEKLYCSCSHIWPPLKTPIGVCVPHDIAQPSVRIQRCLRRSPDRHKAMRAQSKDREISNNRLYGSIRHDIKPHRKRIPWHSDRITTETATNETGRHAHGAMKSKEKRMRKRRSVKLSAPHLKLHRMTSRINGQVRIMTMLGKRGECDAFRRV
jgi:hypothetical protein